MVAEIEPAAGATNASCVSPVLITSPARSTRRARRRSPIALHGAQRLVARLCDQLPVHLGARDPIAGQAALSDAEHVAFAA